MRVLFIIVVVVFALGFGGCGIGKSYIDLRKPIYFVTEQSFFKGCESSPVGEASCRESRRQIVKDGVAQWLNYFEEHARPFVGVVADIDELPYETDNPPIHLSVEKDECDKPVSISVLACYRSGGFFSDPRIIFTAPNSENITSNMMAHEFGHALWGNGDHYNHEDGSPSIMSEIVPVYGGVISSDVDRLCRVRGDCPKRKHARKIGRGKK